MVDSASQAEDILEDAVTYAVHVQLLCIGSEAQARLQSRRRFTCQATGFSIGNAEPVRLGSSGRFA